MIAALLLASAAWTVQPTRLPPVERCANDAGFDAFRASLTAAVAARDLTALTALMSDEVQVSFGGRFGKAQFAAFWSQASAGQADLWKELDAALKLGCATARTGGGNEYRAFPALFITGGTFDGFSTSVSLPGAVLRARPSASARMVMRLPEWTVLGDREYVGGVDWIRVRTPKGRVGYLAIDQSRSIIDYRLIMGQKDGQWRITHFVAGD